jgi:phosphoribosylformylglycinamidine synthase subunit PurQ / glutaminase
LKRIGIIVFPGSNCERDVYRVLSESIGIEADFIWHTKEDLENYDAFILPGGFTFGDRLRAGAIAAHSPVIEQLKRAAAKGVPILGICNGFQILVESNLLPGALIPNSSLKFICKPADLIVENNTTPFTGALAKGQILRIPVAHGEGRYMIEDAASKELAHRNQIIFRYTDQNINGSVAAIAGVSNEGGNVVGMMPHPERTSGLLLSDDGKSDHGLLIFSSLLRYIDRRISQAMA